MVRESHNGKVHERSKLHRTVGFDLRLDRERGEVSKLGGEREELVSLLHRAWCWVHRP